MPRHAAASMAIPAGSGTACSAGSTINPAAVPNGRRHWAFQTQTRSPSRDGGTPAPTRSISPAPSLCGITRGNAILRVVPARLSARAQDIITNTRELAALGWTPATSSNFSMRLDDRHAAITVSGRHKGKLGEADIMVVDFDGQPVAK